MKKLITLLLAVAGMVSTASAYDDIYLRTDFRGTNQWNEDVEANKFTYEYHKDASNEDVYSLTINAEEIKSSDIWFRLHINGWGAVISPFTSNGSHSYSFSNGKSENYGAKYEKTYFQGTEISFGIPHSSIKASQYKITLYRGIDEQFYENENCRVLWIEAEIVSMPLTISDASGYATFSCDRALDFSSVSGVTAYTASAPVSGSVTMTAVSGAVPANTGLFIKGTASETPYTIPVVTTASADAISGNYLHATDGNSVEAGNYVFAKQDDEVGFYKLGSATVIGKGKAYLSSTAASGARLSINFEEATAISSVKSTATESSCFDLQGRRVAQPTKGLYIINGKKVIK